MLMSYIRYCLREGYEKEKNIKPLLTRIVDLDFEKMCLKRYEEIMYMVMKKLERETSLAHDLSLISENNLTANQRFSVIYRSERKKIIRDQLDLIRFIIKVLDQSYVIPKRL